MMWKTVSILAFVANGYFVTSLEVSCIRPHEYYDCGSGCQNTCATYESHCSTVNDRICNGGCYCEDGYVRVDNNGSCIPISECEELNTATKSSKEQTARTATISSAISCKGDPNAMPGCDSECKKRCPSDKINSCKCKRNSCECKEGYVYNSKTRKCTTSDKCETSSRSTAAAIKPKSTTRRDNLCQ